MVLQSTEGEVNQPGSQLIQGDLTVSTLSTHTTTYLAERRKRGELGKRTARAMSYSLASLDRSFGNRPLNQLSKRAIERWLETIGHLAPSTRRNRLTTVRGFCAWMVERGHIPANPCDQIGNIPQPRSVPRAMPRPDLAKLHDVLPDLRARTVVSLMLGCGLRCVEVARLQVTDYDPDVAMIRVVGKGSHERELPVPSEVSGVLDAYLVETGLMSGPLVRSKMRPAAGLSEETISKYVGQWMREAGVKVARWDGRSAHALRHTAASDVLDECQDLRIVQAMLGHAHLSSTAIYLRRAHLGQMRAAMEGRRYTADNHGPPSLRAVA